MTVVDPELVEPSFAADPPSDAPDASGAVRARGMPRLAVWLAAGWILVLAAAALLADVLPLRPFDSLVPDMEASSPPRFGWPEPLGTDGLGRSTLSRLVYGARQTLAIGVCTTAASMAVGLAIGLCAGYFGGWVDRVLNVLVDVVLSVPGIVLLLSIAALGHRDVPMIVAGLAIVTTPTYARLARACTVAIVHREFVDAARVMGATHRRIILRELLPAVIPPVSSFAFLSVAIIVVAEGSLSFLGLGVPPPTPSWGGMVNDGRRLLQDDPHLVFVPAACLFLTVTSLTVLGDSARRRFDTRGSSLR